MKFPTKKWHSHPSPAKSGEATFQIGTSPLVTLQLESFADYMSISGLMDAAVTEGFKEAKEVIKAQIERLSND